MLIPINAIFTSQVDFNNPSVTQVNLDTNSLPGSVLLDKSNIQNVQILDSSNNFKSTIPLELQIDGNDLKLSFVETKFNNLTLTRTKNLSEDYLTLLYSPILDGSEVIRANGITLVKNTDYVLTPQTGRADLITVFGPSTTFESSYVSEGLIFCQGTLETNPISIGYSATNLTLNNIGTLANLITIEYRTSTDLNDLSSSVYVDVPNTNIINLNPSDGFIQIKYTFNSNNSNVNQNLVYKYSENWNTPGSTFTDTVVLNNAIEILSSDTLTTEVTPLPTAVTLAGADLLNDPISGNKYIFTVGGYSSPNQSSTLVRYAMISNGVSLGDWQTASPLPKKSVPYNSAKILTTNTTSYMYVLNNDKSNEIYRTSVGSFGTTNWSKQQPLPKSVEKANLEILSNTTTNEHFLVVQDKEFLYWIEINITSGALIGNWKTVTLPDRLSASSSVFFKKNGSDNIFYLYLLGGVLGKEVQNENTNDIYKVTITQISSTLNFNITKTVQKLPLKISHFPSEFISIGGNSYIYTFGGTLNTDIFANKNIDAVYRIEVDPNTGDLTQNFFSLTPNKLNIPSSSHNTVLYYSPDANVYIIGDGDRTSVKVSALLIANGENAPREGYYETNIIRIPGCLPTLGTFQFNKVLNNLDQVVTAEYRVADSESNMISATYQNIDDMQALVNNLNDQYIQFRFYLSKNPSGPVNELSPKLTQFSFEYVSSLNTISQSPTLNSSTLTFDNNLFLPAGEILLRYDSTNNDSSYTTIIETFQNLLSDESYNVTFRTWNTFPLSGPFLPLSQLLINPEVGRYIEVKISFYSSSDQLFSPILDELQILGVQPQVFFGNAGNFIFHEIPTGVQDEINQQYFVQYEYEPGTLCVFLNGMQLLPNVSYLEDPGNTSFTFIGYAPDSLDVITTNYVKVI